MIPASKEIPEAAMMSRINRTENLPLDLALPIANANGEKYRAPIRKLAIKPAATAPYSSVNEACVFSERRRIPIKGYRAVLTACCIHGFSRS